MNRWDFLALVLVIAFIGLLGAIMWLVWVMLPLFGMLIDIYIIAGIGYGIYKNRYAIKLYIKERENERQKEQGI